jgi:hypothetical protein
MIYIHTNVTLNTINIKVLASYFTTKLQEDFIPHFSQHKAQNISASNYWANRRCSILVTVTSSYILGPCSKTAVGKEQEPLPPKGSRNEQFNRNL